MLRVTITSPRKTTVYRKVKSVTVPTVSGDMQILPGHAESFAVLRQGDIVIRQSHGEKSVIHHTGGECHIANDTFTIIL